MDDTRDLDARIACKHPVEDCVTVLAEGPPIQVGLVGLPDRTRIERAQVNVRSMASETLCAPRGLRLWM
jgi:hypothetical protein